jgi:Site-specific recombinases, DNA invertase Pin homologs
MKASRRGTPKPSPSVTRCAVYCRQSVEERGTNGFGSIEAQREKGEAYVGLFPDKHWELVPTEYSDSGFSGGTLERPALTRLRSDIAAGKVDCVVVYRSDRLSRSIRDFLELMEEFDRHGVTFVSVSEQFDTSTPRGRMHRNMLLMFAQYERELIAERTRDKVHAARRKGKFTGGGLILGFDRHPDGGRLVANEGEARRVRKIFRLFEEHPSLVDTIRELNHRGWTLKKWTTKAGLEYGGGPFDVHSLRRMLSNHAYVGKVFFNGTVFDGEHEAIVDQETWDRVQELINNGSRGPRRPSSRCSSLLAGILRCAACDAAMTPTYSQKGRVRYRYYLCTKAHMRGWDSCPTKSVSAKKIEAFVIDKIRGIGRDPELVDQTVEAARQQLAFRKAELEAEAKRIRGDLEKAHADLRKSLKAVSANSLPGPKDAPAREEAIRSLEERLHTVEQEGTAVEAQRIDPADLKAALAAFDPVWSQLEPSEQARVIQLLIERIDYDGGTGNLSIAFRPGGVQTLAAEAAEKVAP